MEPQRKYCTILIKRRISGLPGPPELLNSGELAINEPEQIMYIGTSTSELTGENAITDLGTF